ncbi:MAG: hypothetical protein SFZ24_09105 [Planctomycetota bacterium]|nr:hypothetical protein [Planctomycetota bacterium]
MTAPSMQSDPSLARGVLAEASSDRVVLTIPGTDYQLHLGVYQRPAAAVGKRLIGRINASARRVDVVNTGGRYIEPVYGRPRRVQGQVTAVHPGENSITVHAGAPMVCKLTDPRQKAEQFKVGDFVSFDVLAGATFHETAGR